MTIDSDILILLVKMVMGFAATVSAVLLWSKTREAAWLFVVMATVFLYAEVIIKVLEMFGLSNLYFFSLYGIPLFELIFAFFPFLFFAIGFIIFLVGRRKRL